MTQRGGGGGGGGDCQSYLFQTPPLLSLCFSCCGLAHSPAVSVISVTAIWAWLRNVQLPDIRIILDFNF